MQSEHVLASGFVAGVTFERASLSVKVISPEPRSVTVLGVNAKASPYPQVLAKGFSQTVKLFHCSDLVLYMVMMVGFPHL